MIKNGIDYAMQSEYYGFITKDSEQRILKGNERVALYNQIEKFTDNYKEWYIKARRILEKEYKVGKITPLQINTFYDRQAGIADCIDIICEKCYLGEVFFDFNCFEQDNMGKYESRGNYEFWKKVASEVVNFNPVHPEKPPKKRALKWNGDIDFQAERNGISALAHEEALKDWEAYYTRNVNKDEYVSVKNGIEYRMWNGNFGVITKTSRQRTLTPAQRTAVEKAYDEFIFSYNDWYAGTKRDLEIANGEGFITDAQLNVFYASQGLIKRYFKVILDACKKGKVYFDFAGFEKCNYFKYASQNVFVVLEDYANYSKYYDADKNELKNFALRYGGDYEMKAKHFGVLCGERPPQKLSAGIKQIISKDIEKFKYYRKNWYDNAKTVLENAYKDKKITEAQLNTFYDRQKRTENYLKIIFDKCLNGEVFMDFASFENDYIKTYESKEVFLLYERLIKEAKRFTGGELVSHIHNDGIWYNMKTKYFGVISSLDKHKTLTSEQVATISAQANAFIDSYEKWFSRAKTITEKAYSDKRIAASQLYAFYIRQRKTLNYFNDIIEKCKTGKVYFDFEGFRKECFDKLESRGTFSLIKSIAEETENA